MAAVVVGRLPLRLANERLTLRLYRNDHFPRRGDQPGAYREATFSGYRPVSLGRWVVDSETGARHPYVVFQSAAHQAQQLVYGYYATDAGGEVRFAERFRDGPYAVRCVRDRILVSIRRGT